MNKVYENDAELFSNEVYRWEHSDSDKGQVYTRPEVVNFMLISIGLNNESLENIRILEPACGEGEFVVAIVKYLIKRTNYKPTLNQLLGKLLAVDIVGVSVEIAMAKVHKLLIDTGYSESDTNELLNNWFLKADFLLENIEPNFTHIIGNPPYVRVENIPKALLNEYRRRYSTMTNRADLYIPFFEKSLSLLNTEGRLSFICTDRWTKNIYGQSLRQFISDNFSLELFIDLYDIEAFEQEVMTYPAITQIGRHKKDSTILLHETSFTVSEADEIVKSITGQSTLIPMRKGIVNGSQPWLIGTSDQIELIQRLEDQYPTLEQTGCKVYIGTATGANKIYIVDIKSVDIERSRLLPVVTANDLKTGSIKWGGKHLISTYDQDGVVDLNDYPKLKKYLNTHKDQLSKRHIAKKKGVNWFKTIDRVYEERLKCEKLLVPDISSDPIVIYDKGKYHPNNSIYYICSNDWNLQALKVVLLSDITKLFISIYSTKIAKGYFRFQAQHLRKLRLPAWSSINNDLQLKMIQAGTSDDTTVFSGLTYEMYKLSDKEKIIMGD